MKKLITLLAFTLAFTATSASAACVVEYKAKRDNPLRLTHGSLTVSGNNCTASAVSGTVRSQLSSQGWTLLSILSVRKG
mgnify:CR=1 FL=1